MSIERVLFFVLFICLATRSAAVTCPDLCNKTSSAYICGTYNQVPAFLNVAGGLSVWFSATLKNAAAMGTASISFTQQTITVNGVSWNPPDADVNLGSSGTSSTSFTGGKWVTNAGSSCGDVFLSGHTQSSGGGISGGSFTWCGVFTSSTQNLPDPQWSFGAVAYNSFSSSYPALGVRSSSSTTCTPAGDNPNAAGQPQNYYYQGGNIQPGGTKRQELDFDPTGRQETVTSKECYCPTTLQPTRAPTNAPTKAPTTASPTKAPTNAPTVRPTNAPTAPTNAPTAAPSNAPTARPTNAPTNAPTARPTSAPTTAAPTNAPTVRPTSAPTAPTNAPTSRPTSAPTTAAPTTAPTIRPTRVPTVAPTATPTRAPTPPTNAPSRGPTVAPTVRPTSVPTAPTNAPTSRPTTAPTTGSPTNAPTVRPTRAPTEEPTGGPTRAPTAPTNAPSRAPTEEPTGGPTRAPTAPTNEPTVAPTLAPTNFPTIAPTNEPTDRPTEAPTAPTAGPTNSPTAPTNRPTRFPTAPTVAPPTVAPTTAAPTAPVNPCTRSFTASFTLTYDQMTNGYVTGTLVYDYPQNVLAFYYTNQSYQEIYKFNSQYGYGNTNNQEVYKISPNGTCAPCSRYQNQWAFPVFWNISGVANPYPNGPADANGCTNYTVPTSNNNWAQYFGLRTDGTLCYISNQGRLFKIEDLKYCQAYDPGYITPPAGCTCNTPQDIAFSLDRSSSIFTESTYLYREFLQQFVNSYNFDPTSPTTSTQMGIVQWGNILNEMNGLFPVGRFGSIPFTMDPVNVNAAVQNVGCTGVPCNFCGGNGNNSYCIFPTQYKTCTSCGLYGAGKLFTDTNYFKKRATSSQVIIVITDGNANTLNSSWSTTGSALCCGDGDPNTGSLIPGVNPNCDDGLYQTYAPLGCFTDILAVKDQVLSMVPGVTIFAIGVGPAVNLDTLKVIANNDNNAFVAPDFQTLLNQIQSIVTLTCVEPHPITSCGTGQSACGFCACGQTKLPDGIIPANLCDSVTIVPQAQCFTRIPVPLNCTKKPCETASCDPKLNNGTGGCIWGPTVCNQPDPCFTPACIAGVCVGKAVCNTSIIGCCPTDAPTGAPTEAPVGTPTDAPTPPTAPPTIAPECLNSTSGLGCGKNGNCNTTTGKCECVGGFHGAICQFAPGEPECLSTTECDDSDPCTVDLCDPVLGGVCTNIAADCNDNNACTLDFCNASGCQNVENVPCDDGDGCSEDLCNATDGKCYHVFNNCSNYSDICNIGYCDPKAPKEDQCYQASVICPRINNCTLAFCLLDVNGSGAPGCTNQTLDCTNIGGVIAGIAAGVLAAIVVVAILAAAGLAGGGAYAVAGAVGANAEAEVISNPLYEGAGTETVNTLFTG